MFVVFASLPQLTNVFLMTNAQCYCHKYPDQRQMSHDCRQRSQRSLPRISHRQMTQVINRKCRNVHWRGWGGFSF